MWITLIVIMVTTQLIKTTYMYYKFLKIIIEQ